MADLTYKDLYENCLKDFNQYKSKVKDLSKDIQSEVLYKIVRETLSPIYNDIKRGAGYGISGCDVILSKMKSNLKNINVIPLDKNIFFQNGVPVMFDEEYAQCISTERGNPFNKGMVSKVVEDGMFDIEKRKTIVHAKVIVFE